MSNVVDNKVVEMRFDNRDFEKNVSKSMSTLSKLKQSLNLSGASKGIEKISSAAKNVTLTPLTSAVETVGLKFNWMYTMADQALRNITNSAYYTGKKIVSALTIDPVKTGFQEYETQINAIQTILANTKSKGSTLTDVNKALDELNTYADKTIYNFTEMTRNIGTFTAAGVDLETSVSSIKGIANLAAVSGSTSAQASNAMYQLSQALAAGKVSLMDWNSVVNAGMGGQVFQDALKRTAKNMGINVDAMIEKYGSFRESLTKGEWLTTEVLTETLTQLSGAYTKADLIAKGYTEQQAKEILDLANTAVSAATEVKTFTQLWDTLKEAAQSGWTQTWEIIVGDFEEAKTLMTNISNVVGEIIGKSADARNKLLQGWKDAGGRNDLLEGFTNIAKSISNIVSPIREAFREVFPPVTVNQLVAFTKGFKELTKKLIIGKENAEKLKTTFKGVFSVFKIIKSAVVAVLNAIKPLFSGVGTLGSTILDVTSKMGLWLISLEESITKTYLFGKTIDNVTGFIKNIIGYITQFVKAVKDIFITPGIEAFKSFFVDTEDGTKSCTKAVETMRDRIVSVFTNIHDTISNLNIVKVLQSIWNGFSKIGSAVSKFVGSIFGNLAKAFTETDFSNVFDFFNSAAIGGILVFIGKFIKSISDLTGSAGGFLENVTGILDDVRGCFQAYQSQLKAGALLKIASAIAILAASIFVISLIDSEKLSDSLKAITVLFADLIASVAILGKLDSLKLRGTMSVIGMMNGVAVAVLILASALKVVASMDSESLFRGLVGIVVLTGTLVGAIKLLELGGKKAFKGATKIVIFAAAIKILASVCEDLAKLNWEELAKGLIGVGVLLAEVAGFMYLMKFAGNAKSSALGIVLVASAIKILASSCKDFASMSIENIIKGLSAVGILLGELAAFTMLTKNSKNMISVGIGMIAVAAAIKILTSSVKDISKLSWSAIAKGLLGLAGALAAVTIAMKFMPKNMIRIGVGLIAVSTAIVILTEALIKMSGMSWEGIAKGLAALGGSLFILAAGLALMKGSVKGSAALLIATIALAALAPVLKSLGDMSWESIAKSLIVLAGAFTVIGVAGLLLKPLVPTLLHLSAAMVIFGIGVAAIGVGVFLIGAGITAIATGIGALAAALSGGATAIVAGISAIIMGVVDLIPTIAIHLAEAIVKFAEVIIDGAPTIAEAVKAVVLNSIDVLVECIPAITEGALSLIMSVLQALVEYSPKIIDLIFQLIINILNGLSARIPELIKAVVDVFKALFSGVVDVLSGMSFDEIIDVGSCVGIITGLMYALSKIGPLTGSAMAGALGAGAVAGELAVVIAALGGLAQIPGLDWLINEGGNLLQSIGTALGKLVGGLVGGIAEGFSASLPQIGTDLSTFMTNVQPFIEGAKNIDASVLEGIGALAGTILVITGADIIHGIASFLTGGNSIADFGSELVELGKGLVQFSNVVTGIDVASVTAAATAGKILADMASTIPNEGGVAAWFAGENSIAKFGTDLVELGVGLKGFADNVSGIDTASVTAAATAASSLADMASKVPNEGGVAAWFAGENSIAKFGTDLISLGIGLKTFSITVSGIDTASVAAAVTAASSLVVLASNVPNEGGVVSWFTGDNSIAKFGTELISLGNGLKGFADSVSGIDAASVTSAATAATALTEMASNVPNEGGVVSWFTGDNSIAKFGTELISLGIGLKTFSVAVSGIDTASVAAAVVAASSLVVLASKVPNEGGVVSWFAGDNSIAKFGTELISLGIGLKGFASSVSGIDASSMSAAVTAADALTTLASNVPNEGGVVSWFTGDNSIADFGTDLIALGNGLKGFASSVVGIDASSVASAAIAAGKIAEMTTKIPTEGGVTAWFTGDTSIAKFGTELISLGIGLKGFAISVAGINAGSMAAATVAAGNIAEMTTKIPTEGGIKAWLSGDTSIAKFGTELINLGIGLKGFAISVDGIKTGSIIAAANAGKTLAEMAKIVPSEGGIKAWFSGDSSMAGFSKNLPTLGEGIKSFSDKVSGIKCESVKTASVAAITLAKLSKIVPDNDSALSNLGSQIKNLGIDLNVFSQKASSLKTDIMEKAATTVKSITAKIAGINASGLSNAIEQVNKLTKLAKNISGTDFGGIASMEKSLGKIGKNGINNFISAFSNAGSKTTSAVNKFINSILQIIKNANPKFKTSGDSIVSYIINGINGSKNKLTNAMKTSISSAVTAIRDKYQSFYNAGSYLVTGFVNGINDNMYKAKAKATAMANAAKIAAEEALDENSPSKEFYRIGAFAGMGFINALSDYESKTYNAGESLADSVKVGFSKSIDRIRNVINSDMDMQPRIRPVIDMSDVENGVNSINNMLSFSPSTRLMSDIGTINSMMNSRIQNGNNDDVVSAINKLRKDIGNVGGTTNIVNGVTYDDGSNISNAVEAIVRAARIERRV